MQEKSGQKICPGFRVSKKSFAVLSSVLQEAAPKGGVHGFLFTVSLFLRAPPPVW